MREGLGHGEKREAEITVGVWEGWGCRVGWKGRVVLKGLSMMEGLGYDLLGTWRGPP